MEPAVKCAIHRLLSSTKQSILNPGEDLSADLQCVKPLLPSSSITQSEFEDLEAARRVFRQHEYGSLLKTLIHAFNTDWMTHIPRGKMNETVDIFFLNGWPTESLVILGHSLASSSGYKQQKIISLLENLLTRSAISDIVWEQCCSPVAFWDEVVILLVSLPDRVAAKLQDEPSSVFERDAYIQLIAESFQKILTKLHDQLSKSENTSITPLSELFGKYCLHGYADALWERLLPWLLSRLSQSESGIWLRLCEGLISKIPTRCMESCVVALVAQIPWFGHMSKFLGSTVLINRNLQFLLTNKLLLIRHHHKPLILQNIIGYLATTTSLKSIFCKTMHSLLDVWANASAVKHSSYEQQFYISQAIFICSAFIKTNPDWGTELKEVSAISVLNKLLGLIQEKDMLYTYGLLLVDFTSQTPQQRKNFFLDCMSEDLLRVMLSGMQYHLESSVEKVRILGMAVAEVITQVTEESKDRQLQFQYEKDQDIEMLMSLLAIPEDPGIEHVISQLEEIRVEAEVKEEVKEGITACADEELDSDDDLEPFDMTNDTKINAVKRPLYLRECMEGLISGDAHDRVEICLRSAESLIRKHPKMLQEIAAEFMKILLHLEKNFYMPDFVKCRHGAMVALLVNAPSECAPYLTGRLYATNYHLRHRMDILEVLAQAAQELAEPEKGKKVQPVVMALEAENWRAVVDERVERKTRRFGKGRQIETPEAKNRFAPVAALFFFPLLSNYDTKEVTLDLLGADHIVFSRLLHTLGIIMYSAVNTPICPRMAVALADFLWLFTYHPQGGVRQAVLFAVCMLLLATPPHVLFTDLQDHLMNLKPWLEDSVEKDSDADCRKLALQALHLLQNSVKKEFNPNEDLRC